MGMSLDAGGHLTHGAPPAHVGQMVQRRPVWRPRRTTICVDFDEVERLANEHKPKLIIAGGIGLSAPSAISRASAPSRTRSAPICWSTWRTSPASSPAACIPRPFGHAHVVTTTTHKTLRGPRGGMILTNDEAIAKKINSAVFPGLQGGPLMHVIAAKAVAFGEALQPEFKTYAAAVVDNAKALAAASRNAAPTSSPAAPTPTWRWSTCARSGSPARTPTKALERAAHHLQQERHPVRSAAAGEDQRHPRRHARPARRAASAPAEFRDIGDMIADVLDGLRQERRGRRSRRSRREVNGRVRELCARFPIYPEL